MNLITESSNNFQASPRNQQKLHLAYLDGMRGLAAFYVVLVHSWNADVAEALQPALLWFPVTKFLRYGMFAVVIFIVLSGYCLMLPVLRSQTRYFSGGLLGFFKRRIRRILPPYYAALAFCMVVGVFILGLERVISLDKDSLKTLRGLFSPYFSFHDVLVYVLMIQNFGLHLNKINGPMWTIAVEWQIYIVFAVLLIPIWRHLGLLSTLTIAILLGLTLNYSIGEVSQDVCPWFLGLFALGMASAEISFSQKQSLLRMKKSLPWGILAAVFAFFALGTEWLRFNQIPGMAEWIVHYFVALATACFMVYCTKFIAEGKPLPPVVRLLESRWVVALGVISYSLYLTHAPVVWVVYQVLVKLQLSPTLFATQWFLISVPLSLLVANLFHRVFERPFMSNNSLNVKSQKSVNSEQ